MSKDSALPRWLLRTIVVATGLSAGGPVARSAAVTPVSSAAELRYPELPEFVIPKPEQVTLKNGMILLLLPDRELPLVSGTALIKTGARLEPAAKAGLAALTGAVMRSGGTRTRNGDAIDDLLEGIGAQVETGIGADQGRAGFSCLTRDLDTVLGVVAEMLREPAFAEDKLSVAKSQARAGISRRNDDVQAITRREFARQVYGIDSAYTRQQEYATLDAIGRADLVAFHAAGFRPNRTLLGLTGDFDPKAARKLVEKHFGSWQRGADAPAFVGGYQLSTRPEVLFIEKTDVNQSNIVLGHLGILTSDPDYFAVSVLNEVFGGGFAARLFSSVRSRQGLAYSVGGSVGDDFDHPGLFRISLLTKSETTVAGIRALREELDKIRKEPPTAEEMKRARASILNSFVFNFDTRPKILERQLAYLYYGYPLDFLDRFRSGIEKVSAQDVLAAARKHMRPEQMLTLVVGHSQNFDRPLSELGEVKSIDISIPPPARAEVRAATAESSARGTELVARAVAAIGGKDSLAKIAALRTVGEARVTTPMGEMAMKSTLLWQSPDRIRQERQTPAGTMTMVITGDRGWALTPMGQQDVPAAQVGESLASIRRTLPILLGDPALSAQHLGTEAGAERVLVRAHKLEVTLWIDSQGLVLKDSYAGQGLGGAPAEIQRSYGDWRKTGELFLPYTVQATADGKPFQQVTFSTIESNPAIDPKVFEKPASAGP